EAAHRGDHRVEPLSRADRVAEPQGSRDRAPAHQGAGRNAFKIMPLIMRWAAAFVVGAVLCTVLDHQHVVWGVLSYPHPDFWQQAWWVPLLFGCAALAAVFVVDPIRRLLSGVAGTEPAFLAWIDAGTFAAAYYFTAVANHEPDLVAGVLVGTWLVRVAAG